MNDFTIAVFSKNGESDVSKLLAPYEEITIREGKEEYLKFLEISEHDVPLYEKYRYSGKYRNFEDFALNYLNLEKDNLSGKIGVYTNPNSKWKDYKIGFKDSKGLLTKDGRKVNSAKIKDIDFDLMQKEGKEDLISYFNSQKKSNEDIDKSMYIGLKKDETIEEYLNRESLFSTMAVVMPNGNWIEEEYSLFTKYCLLTKNETIIPVRTANDKSVPTEEEFSQSLDTWTRNYKKDILDTLDGETFLTIISFNRSFPFLILNSYSTDIHSYI